MAITQAKKTQTNGKPVIIPSDVKKNIDTHKKAASHHETAAKFHLEAAKNHEAGNHGKAHENAIMASGHSNEAHDLERADVKHHALAS